MRFPAARPLRIAIFIQHAVRRNLADHLAEAAAGEIVKGDSRQRNLLPSPALPIRVSAADEIITVYGES